MYEPRRNTCFSIDHTTLVAKPVKDKAPSFGQAIVDTRNVLDQQIADYVQGFFPLGASSVFATKASGFKIYIVANKYSLSNFLYFILIRAGRWKSEWTLSADAKKLTGTISVKVHYYEDGNVQLESSQNCEIAIEVIMLIVCCWSC